MDPIHPIVPQSPVLPPVAPAPRAEAVNRDGPRSGGQQQTPQRRRRTPSPTATRPAIAPPFDELSDEGEDPRPHVDITV
jgi:hypothetical protein